MNAEYDKLMLKSLSQAERILSFLILSYPKKVTTREIKQATGATKSGLSHWCYRHKKVLNIKTNRKSKSRGRPFYEISLKRK